MSDTEQPPPWVLVARNLLIAWGVFETRQACSDFADQRGQPRDAMDTIPLGYVDLEQADRTEGAGSQARSSRLPYVG
jgi:hypothetical protein